jgi:hypothetical protein
MKTDEFRKLALDLPEAVESTHMSHPDFRVSGKIFATLGYPNANSAVVKLSPAQQQKFIENEPAVFAPAAGAWGRRGYTQLHLSAARAGSVRQALLKAWSNTAPKRLLESI